MQDEECQDTCFERFTAAIKMYPKLRYKIKEIYGDYYYEMMTVEETMQKAFYKPRTMEKELRSQNDINMYIRDNLNQKLPLDGPQWMIYSQNYNPTDQADLPKEFKTKGITILKAHHSLCDGVSIMCMVLSASGTDYSRDFFIKSADAKWYEALFVKLTSILTIPKIVYGSLLASTDDNYITKRKHTFSGNLNVS